MTLFRTFAAAALIASPLAFTAPAMAQDAAEEETVNMVIVYGDDRCPESTADQIVVCARQAENERYRIPQELRLSDDPANNSWAERVEQLEMVGASGAFSCSPSGAGGFTGCTQEMIRKAYADKANASSIRFGQLVDAARADRLGGIDAEAAAEQERVEMIERDYMERLERERAAPTADETTESATPGNLVTEEELSQPPEL
ncbi:hypothetical protein [Qipengyuania marisflavi]|uniref:Uncharacterized protein n=1 Tax=Qipengyuania marisflavi TaxID=2486356 RepID=A0A5S3PAT5_9SPHN|nr:hypothetical protein [Qipengyuania marisflavi]TMM48158.1 hypothetical protein FEV51_07620 [Qipengyuania marisflavi]